MFARLLPTLALTFLFVTGHAAEPTKTVRLLTVGNSFSQNATRHLGSLAKAGGHTLILHRADIGGSTMQQHWDKAQLHEKDPQDPAGRYNTKKSLKQELQAEPWDYITIQQASIRSHDLSTYRPYAAKLKEYIHGYAPKAELMLHQTWAYRRDDPRFSAKKPLPGAPLTQAEMHEQLTHAYRTIATELGLRLLPVGDAFHMADTDPAWAFVPDTAFDPKTAKRPALPNQKHSLHVGWQWKKPKDQPTIKMIMDGHHANTAGEYLGACVWYEVMFKESPVGNTFLPKGLSAEDAKYLQEIAHKAVVQSHAEAPKAAAP